MQGLNNPSVVVTAVDSTLSDKVNILEHMAQEDAIETQARIDEFNIRAQAIVDSIQTVQRVISTPVPIGVITENYTAIADDQRIVHSSFLDHTLTLPSPIQLYKRRGIVKNSMRGGLLTVIGRFVTGQTVGSSAMIINPVLKPGEGIEYLGYFDLSLTPDANAPNDFYLNGQLAPNGTVGKYRLAIVAFNQMQMTVDEIQAEFNVTNNLIESKTSWIDTQW